jgi:hypothetical protein
MSWEWLPGFIKAAWAVISWFIETDKRKRAVKKEALGQLREGLRERDPSKVTAAFNRVKNV